jgi:hypothetical protein
MQAKYMTMPALLSSRRTRGVDPCLDRNVVDRRLRGPGLPRRPPGEPAGVIARRSAKSDQQADEGEDSSSLQWTRLRMKKIANSMIPAIVM